MYTTSKYFSHAGKAQLNLTCSDSEAAIEVVIPDGDTALNRTDIKGRCITPEWEEDNLMEVYHSRLFEQITATPHIIFSPWCMRKGYSSRSVCVCVCVCLSVTTLTATYPVLSPKFRYH